MPYQNTIPQPTDVFPNSQQDILNNFSSLNTQFGLEHQPLITGTGKHNYVTLQQAVVSAPAGTDSTLSQQLTANTNPFLRYYDSTGQSSVILARTVNNKALPVATTTVFDFAINTMPACMGLALAIDTTNNSRTIFSPFMYFGGVVSCPGTKGQLVSGTQLTQFVGNVTALQLINTGPATSATIKIIYSPL